ncbi:MAG: DoxX family protein [Hyphomicrobiaceae bacterium]
MIDGLRAIYNGFFGAIEWITDGWFLGLAARLMFSSALMLYFLNSAATKVGSGFPAWFVPTTGAYAQILPTVAEQYGYNADKIPFLPYGAIVYAGTYAEFVLPILLLVGLFTRLSSVGLIGFIIVMTFVDMNFHGVDAKAIGEVFDRVHDSAISDQRLLWCFPLLYLTLKGPGGLSLDTLLGHFIAREEI